MLDIVYPLLNLLGDAQCPTVIGDHTDHRYYIPSEAEIFHENQTERSIMVPTTGSVYSAGLLTDES